MHRENETALGKPYIQQTNILAIPTNHPPFPSITQMGRKKLRRKWRILANSATKLGKKLKKFQFMTSNKNWKDFVDTDADISMFQKCYNNSRDLREILFRPTVHESMGLGMLLLHDDLLL